MKLTIEIDLEQDAFFTSRCEEAARILAEIAEDFPKFMIGYRAPLRDINGNTVGHAEVTL